MDLLSGKMCDDGFRLRYFFCALFDPTFYGFSVKDFCGGWVDKMDIDEEKKQNGQRDLGW